MKVKKIPFRAQVFSTYADNTEAGFCLPDYGIAGN
jgi:hypothetical protein